MKPFLVFIFCAAVVSACQKEINEQVVAQPEKDQDNISYKIKDKPSAGIVQRSVSGESQIGEQPITSAPLDMNVATDLSIQQAITLDASTEVLYKIKSIMIQIETLLKELEALKDQKPVHPGSSASPDQLAEYNSELLDFQQQLSKTNKELEAAQEELHRLQGG